MSPNLSTAPVSYAKIEPSMGNSPPVIMDVKTVNGEVIPFSSIGIYIVTPTFSAILFVIYAGAS